MKHEDDEATDRIAKLEAERRALLALSIAYDQLLDRLVRTRRYRLAKGIEGAITSIPAPIRSRLEYLARIVGAKVLRPIGSTPDHTELERKGLQDRLHGVLFSEPASTGIAPHLDASGSPPVSIVSVIYKSGKTLVPFLEAFRTQDYPGPIEIVLVDDASGDDSPNEVTVQQAAFSDPQRTLKLLRNDRNMGNCVSRNRGVAAATGEIICILDADCIVNEGFVTAHVALHSQGRDVVIGPMGIESTGRPVAPLMAQLIADRSELQAQMHLQDPANLESAVNCVTRNLSVSRRAVEGLGRELFDPRFTYRNAPDTGYGWEDVELGAALRRWGARMGFAWGAVSIHVSHSSSVAERTRALGSARNFALLIETHPHLLREARDWVITTADRIASWATSSGADPAPHLGAVLSRLQSTESRSSPPICVYSAAAGGYQPSSIAVTQFSTVYRLFTEGDPIEGWQIRRFDEVRDDPVRTAKKPKVLPHLYLDDADWSIWIDGNITLLANPRELVAEVKQSGYLIGAFRHQERDCAYDEALRCVSAAKDDADTILAQVNRYREKGFPAKFGLAECNVLVRCHSDPTVAAAMRWWWDEIEAGSRRDQISFTYALWRSGIGYHELAGGRWDVRGDARFRYRPHKAPLAELRSNAARLE